MNEIDQTTSSPPGAGDAGLKVRMRGEERRINSQHEKLDVFCREVYVTLGKDGPTRAIGAFLLFAAALDAHLTVEEDIYFPAMHGLRPDAGPDLSALVEEHARIRVGLEDVKAALKGDDAAGATRELDRLAHFVSQHEKAEEDLITRINEGPLAASSAERF